MTLAPGKNSCSVLANNLSPFLATKNHGHPGFDVEYSAADHEHDVDYSAIGHDHDADYSAIGHDHDADYSAYNHNHDAAYSAYDHNHDADYSAIGHDHNSLYAAFSHNHDADYSAIGHDHDADYYTEVEIDNLLDDKADDDHGHSGSAMVGEIRMFAGSFLPDGFLWCNGQPFDEYVFGALYGVIGYTFGVSGGHPCVPNLESRFPMGGSMSVPRGATGGASTHTLTVTEMPSHSHLLGYRYRVGSGANYVVEPAFNMQDYWTGQGTLYAGGGGSHNNMPPWLSVYYIIYAGG